MPTRNGGNIKRLRAFLSTEITYSHWHSVEEPVLWLITHLALFHQHVTGDDGTILCCFYTKILAGLIEPAALGRKNMEVMLSLWQQQSKS